MFACVSKIIAWRSLKECMCLSPFLPFFFSKYNFIYLFRWVMSLRQVVSFTRETIGWHLKESKVKLTSSKKQKSWVEKWWTCGCFGRTLIITLYRWLVCVWTVCCEWLSATTTTTPSCSPISAKLTKVEPVLGGLNLISYRAHIDLIWLQLISGRHKAWNCFLRVFWKSLM